MYEKSNMKGDVLWATKTGNVVDYEFDFDDEGEPRGFRFNKVGFHKFEVPVNGTYKLEAVGAQGGKSYENKDGTSYKVGGKGAIISGYFNFTKGDVLRVAVGGKGGDGSRSNSYGSGGGGGGASSVVRVDGNFDSLADEDNTKLIIAGGGGGAGPSNDGK